MTETWATHWNRLFVVSGFSNSSSAWLHKSLDTVIRGGVSDGWDSPVSADSPTLNFGTEYDDELLPHAVHPDYLVDRAEMLHAWNIANALATDTEATDIFMAVVQYPLRRPE